MAMCRRFSTPRHAQWLTGRTTSCKLAFASSRRLRPVTLSPGPFNVYVFPRPVDEKDPYGMKIKSDQYFGLSASTALFLTDNGFDFQRWVTKGVSYVPEIVEAALAKVMPSSENSALACDKHGRENWVHPKRPADIELVNNTMKEVDEFAAKGECEMMLPRTNRFLALALRQRNSERHPSLTVEKRTSATDPNCEDRWVVNLSEEVRRQRDDAIRSRVLAQIGFRRMWTL